MLDVKVVVVAADSPRLVHDVPPLAHAATATYYTHPWADMMMCQ